MDGAVDGQAESPYDDFNSGHGLDMALFTWRMPPLVTTSPPKIRDAAWMLQCLLIEAGQDGTLRNRPRTPS